VHDEASACTILKNSIIKANGVCWKIPDPSSTFNQTIPRPFDMFGTLGSRPWYAEVKYLKGLKSFNLQDIKDHQIENLCTLKYQLPTASCWIVLAIKAGRGDNRFYIFEDVSLIASRRTEKQNYLKKELELLPYFPVFKELIDLTNFTGGT
jgi:hypothetical protein